MSPQVLTRTLAGVIIALLSACQASRSASSKLAPTAEGGTGKEGGDGDVQAADCAGSVGCPAGSRLVAGTCSCVACVSTLTCPGGICPASTATCSAQGSCSSNTDCKDGTFCNPSGTCEQNFAGGPCSTAANCLGEGCLSGFCGCLVMRTEQAPTDCSYDVVAMAIDAGTAGSFGAYAATWVAYIGQELVARDTSHQNGWDFDKASGKATFYGDACRRISGDERRPVAVVGAKCPLGPP